MSTAVPSEDKGVFLVCSTDSLNDLPRLLPDSDGLLASARLHTVGVGVDRQNLSVYVVLDEGERLATGRVVGVDQRLLTIDCVCESVLGRSDDRVSD